MIDAFFNGSSERSGGKKKNYILVLRKSLAKFSVLSDILEEKR